MQQKTIPPTSLILKNNMGDRGVGTFSLRAVFLKKLFGRRKRNMARKATTKETITKNTIRDMKELGTYKPEYDPLINVYADIMSEYLRVNKQFEESGYQYEALTAAGNPKKSALASALESLRKDLIAYSDRLCLNPKSLNVEPPKEISEGSPLDRFLMKQ